MRDDDIHRIVPLLREAVMAWQKPAVTEVAGHGDPFQVLVSCILSLRTQDHTTAAASKRLFSRADNPYAMQSLPIEVIEQAIYPVGFYRTKAVQIHDISRQIVENYGGKVPEEMDALLQFRGVGRKTANLVISVGFGRLAICVDVHVHRICNRWGYVRTVTPEQTEMALRAKLPSEYWIEINDLLVTFGQNQCCPVSPRCSTCCLTEFCDRNGVTRSR